MASWAVRSARGRFLLALFLGGSSFVGISHLRKALHLLRKEQYGLAERAATRIHPTADASNSSSSPSPNRSNRRPVVAVDARFVRRLAAILRVCIPGLFSKEAGLVLFQAALLFARTLLSNRIAALEGRCAQNVTGRNWPAFKLTLIAFATTAIPAALVNSALKAIQLAVRLSMRKRLSVHLHRLYMTHRAYYSASSLGGLEHAEQRLTEDVDKFCETASELFSKTLKPLFDLLVFSKSLSNLIGYRGQAIIYTYFIVVGAFLKHISPPLAKLTAQYSSLDGAFRKAHARVSASAEEIAFNDPPSGRAEMRSLDQRLDNMIRHSRLTAVQRFVQQCVDGYLVKYSASVIGLLVHAAPIYFSPPTDTANQLAGKYVNSMRLMMQGASAMGELVMSYKRVLSLAGHTARVAELVEQVRLLGRPQGHLDAFRAIQNRIIEASGEKDTISQCATNSPPVRKCGESIKLEKVTMWSPDGSTLVKDLDMEVKAGRSVIICGPNGCGKSSILRMLAGLWPLQTGTVLMPPRDQLFFLSQKPYMFSGTLAEQLMYPNLPGVVIGDTVMFDEMRARDCLEKVELVGLIGRTGGFGGSLAWDETLSGGEKGRLAVARCLYHQPKFAILDECTAAVSAQGEIVLYKAMADAGITLLSVAHREAVKQFHLDVVTLSGDHEWDISSIEPTIKFPPNIVPNGTAAGANS